jgi:hypothetical protein
MSPPPRKAHSISDARTEQLEHVAALDRLRGADFDTMGASDAVFDGTLTRLLLDALDSTASSMVQVGELIEKARYS